MKEETRVEGPWEYGTKGRQEGGQPKPKETLDQTLYKSSTEQLHVRAIEERIRHNLTGWHSALMPREY